MSGKQLLQVNFGQVRREKPSHSGWNLVWGSAYNKTEKIYQVFINYGNIFNKNKLQIKIRNNKLTAYLKDIQKNLNSQCNNMFLRKQIV